jgi:hypothetical protein
MTYSTSSLYYSDVITKFDRAMFCGGFLYTLKLEARQNMDRQFS